VANSLTHVLAENIRADYIDSGRVAPGDRLPTVRDLERQYGASKATIAHALSILALRGLVDKKHGRGCYVASRPSEQKAGAARPPIGLLISTTARVASSLRSPSPAEIMMKVYEGVEGVAQQFDRHVVIASTNADYDTEREQLARLVAAGCQAVVLYPVPRLRRQLRSDYLNTEHRDVPIVLVDLGNPEHHRSQVVFDNYRAGLEMTRRLIEEEHRHIAFMEPVVDGGEIVIRSNRDRYQGYLTALRQAGLTQRPQDHWPIHPVQRDFVQETAALVGQWKQRSKRATALVAFEDCWAVHTVNAARELGIDVPGDLRVVGFDNQPFAHTLGRSLPTTDPDFRRAGETAAYLAIRHARGELKGPVTYMLPVSILWSD